MNTQGMGISKINVHGYRPHSDTASAGWDKDGARFHVWFNVKTKEIQNGVGHAVPTIYKNAIAEHGQPGYFQTRYLDATKAGNAATVAHVLRAAYEKELVAKAVAEYEETERKRIAKAQEQARQERIRECGPELLAAVQWAIENCGAHPILVAAMKKAQS